MGFKDWVKEQAAEGARIEAARQEAKRSAKESAARNVAVTSFEGISVGREFIEFEGVQYPTAGARAFVEIGGIQRRVTGTRMVVGTIIAPGVGTLIGAMAKKKSNNVYVTVEFADGQAVVVEAKPKQEGDARRFAAAVTSTGTR
ncbi:hypothetical protein [Rhodococcus sp. NPDC060176]|uniref:hypothetical protein n=1 Tax=Rhodococcus sp. NPDC060176 TaxID=3347062 RepID=UPI00365D8A9B